ncbi:MAG: hypothetical protein SGILL_007258, partial [Bacillariaceae sp.]
MSLLLSPPSSSKPHQLEESDDFSRRGLEGRITAEKFRRRQSRHDTIIAVLEEQWYQKVEGCTNEAVIAHVYRNFSKLAQDEARQRAEEDADFVRTCVSVQTQYKKDLSKAHHPRPDRIVMKKKRKAVASLKPL